jgi:hypothetical protein
VGAKFSAPVQTGTGDQPASCTMVTGSYLGVKRPGRGVDHPPPSSAEVTEITEPRLYSPSGPSWPVLGRTLPLPSLFHREFSTHCDLVLPLSACSILFPKRHLLTAYVFFVFLPLLPFLLSFLQKRVLEGSSYARCNQSS